MENPKDYVGKKYGRLTLTDSFSRNNKSVLYFVCKCDCGNTKKVKLDNLKTNLTTSCGCYAKEQAAIAKTTHGNSKHPLYTKRRNIIDRCYNINHISYTNYGGRGITVCKEWLDDFNSFYKWAIDVGWQEGLDIDRIDNNGNYEPSNCHFVKPHINALNKRTTKMVEFKGVTKPLLTWCEELNMNYKTVFRRITSLKWSVEKAFLTKS